MKKRKGFAQIIDQVAKDAGLPRGETLRRAKIVSECLFPKGEENGRGVKEPKRKGKKGKGKRSRSPGKKTGADPNPQRGKAKAAPCQAPQ